MVMRVSLVVFGVLCLGFALIPLVGYGIFNVGVAGLGGVGAACLLLPMVWARLEGHPRVRGVILTAVLLGLAVCLAASFLIAQRGWFTPPPASGEVAVVVLGSKINGDRPSLMLWRRLRVAADYMEQNADAVCVVSGGQGPDEDYPEALVMRDTLTEMGIDPVRILMEDRSSNTEENLLYSRELVSGIDRAVISTDGFHQLRASMYAARAGFQEVSSISSLTPWGLLPAYWVREILGVSLAWVTSFGE
jgi:uncharacterized SAM-binding protein YcdF (DUF218 family)